MLVHLPVLSRSGIQLRSIPKLARTEISRDFADALLDVIPAETKRPSFRTDCTKRHVNVRVFRVVVGYRHPFERCAEITFHLRD